MSNSNSSPNILDLRKIHKKRSAKAKNKRKQSFLWLRKIKSFKIKYRKHKKDSRSKTRADSQLKNFLSKPILKKRQYILTPLKLLEYNFIDRVLVTIGEAVFLAPFVILNIPVYAAKAIVEVGTFRPFRQKGGMSRPRLAFVPISDWSRGLFSFLIICLVLILPVWGVDLYKKLNNSMQESRGKVLGQAVDIFEQVKIEDFNDLANLNFSSLHEQFLKIDQELSEWGLLANLSAPGRTAKALVKIGDNLSQAAYLLKDDSNSISSPFIDLDSWRIKIKQISPLIIETEELAQELNIKYLPQKYQESAAHLKAILLQAPNALEQAEKSLDNLEMILGFKLWQRYLFIFQNETELRPSGGFIGSFAVLDIENGKIKDFKMPGGGSYDLYGSLTEKVLSPQALWLLNPHWGFHDANWFMDFPKTAEKLQWFLEKSGYPSVDGVIAINVSVLEELLKITGPIEMLEYEVVVTADNFLDLTQSIVESPDSRATGKPKQFLADLAEVLIDRILSTENPSELLFVILTSLNNKNVQLYFSNPQAEKWVKSHNWSGEIKETDLDYLAVNVANVAGGKQDRIIKQSVEHIAKVKADGSIVNTVKITRTHPWVEMCDQMSLRGATVRSDEAISSFFAPSDELCKSRQDCFVAKTKQSTALAPRNDSKCALNKILYNLRNMRNISYIKIYLPRGSKFIKAQGDFYNPEPAFKQPSSEYQPDSLLAQIEKDSFIEPQSKTGIAEEFGKFSYANFLELEPGETKTIIFEYLLPFKIDNQYSLIIQKQSGVNMSFKSQMDFAQDLKIEELFAKNKSNLNSNNNQIKYFSDLEVDDFWGVIFEK